MYVGETVGTHALRYRSNRLTEKRNNFQIYPLKCFITCTTEIADERQYDSFASFHFFLLFPEGSLAKHEIGSRIAMVEYVVLADFCKRLTPQSYFNIFES
jgi:hypothetical protein